MPGHYTVNCWAIKEPSLTHPDYETGSFGAPVTSIPSRVRMMALHRQEVRASGYLWVCAKRGSPRAFCFQGA